MSLLTPVPLKIITLLFVNIIFGYLGLVVGLDKAEAVDLGAVRLPVSAPADKGPLPGSGKILDTSVIIDGRIADVCDTGFVEGTFVVPQFILHELRHIADSSDPMKRNRGRRGLDVLRRIQEQVHVQVQVVDSDFPKIKEVDAKLIALAKKTGAKIMTNDFNLNKVAELQGVPVLNINELASALKPVILPGESMNVRILKEGKEPGQGIGYLEDGTMVVVDAGVKHQGKSVDVVVTSVLQTTAGRMIFTKMREDQTQPTQGESGYVAKTG